MCVRERLPLGALSTVLFVVVGARAGAGHVRRVPRARARVRGSKLVLVKFSVLPLRSGPRPWHYHGPSKITGPSC